MLANMVLVKGHCLLEHGHQRATSLSAHASQAAPSQPQPHEAWVPLVLKVLQQQQQQQQQQHVANARCSMVSRRERASNPALEFQLSVTRFCSGSTPSLCLAAGSLPADWGLAFSNLSFLSMGDNLIQSTLPAGTPRPQAPNASRTLT